MRKSTKWGVWISGFVVVFVMTVLFPTQASAWVRPALFSIDRYASCEVNTSTEDSRYQEGKQWRYRHRNGCGENSCTEENRCNNSCDNICDNSCDNASPCDSKGQWRHRHRNGCGENNCVKENVCSDSCDNSCDNASSCDNKGQWRHRHRNGCGENSCTEENRCNNSCDNICDNPCDNASPCDSKGQWRHRHRNGCGENNCVKENVCSDSCDNPCDNDSSCDNKGQWRHRHRNGCGENSCTENSGCQEGKQWRYRYRNGNNGNTSIEENGYQERNQWRYRYRHRNGCGCGCCCVEPDDTGAVKGFIFEDSNDDGMYSSTEDKPLVNVEVRITDVEGNVTVVRTDEDGYYYADDIVTGEASVDINEATLPDTLNKEIAIGTDPTDVVIEAGKTTWEECNGYTVLVVQLTGSISGLVFGDTNENNEYDSDDDPLVGVKINITDANGIAIVVETGVDGKYLASGLAEGTAIVDIDEDSLPSDFDKTIVIGTDPTEVEVVADKVMWEENNGYVISWTQ